MRIDKNDPRLIDYALGELTAEEAEAIEAALQSKENAEAREEVNAIHRLAENVGEALETGNDSLEGEQRDAVLDAAELGRGPFRVRSVRYLGYAAVALLTIGAAMTIPYFVRAREAQMREQQDIAMLQERLDDLPYGIERFLITNINNASSPFDWLQDPDLSNEEVRERVRVILPKLEEEAAKLGAPRREFRQPSSYPNAASVPPPPAPQGQPMSREQIAQPEVVGKVDISGQAVSAPPAPSPVGYGMSLKSEEESTSTASSSDDVDAEEVPRYPRPTSPHNEAYAPIVENDFTLVSREPLSTFGVDVDTASYTNVRRFLENGQWPPADAVRIEELVNYFDYDYPQPEGGSPFAVHVDVAPCPWAEGHQLARIALQGEVIEKEARPAVNLVFLLDVSGSMSDANKLPLVKASMHALLRELDGRDRVGIVTYAGISRVALPSTSAAEPEAIRAAIDGLNAGGSTNGAAGIEQAYAMAERHFIKGAANRVVLATDGDFNVGMTDRGDLIRMIESKRDKGVFLTVLGYGMGNIKDATLEQLANKGNGNYAYIDDYRAAQRVLVDQLTGTLVTIAKDVKIQVEFNPANVGAYRLIGYENRALAPEDFNDDRKDAGEIGAGHQVTALYELVPAGVPITPHMDDLRYQTPAAPPQEESGRQVAYSDELMTVKLRYKHPDGAKSARIDLPISKEEVTKSLDDDFRFASAVAAWGMLLRNSRHSGAATLDMVRELAEGAVNGDAERQAFLGLVSMSRSLQR